MRFFRKFLCYLLFVFFVVLIAFSYDYERSYLDYYRKNFDLAWNKFLSSGIFVMNSNYYVSSLNFVYPIGLAQEKMNKSGVRYVFFSLLKYKIDRRLIENGIYCNVKLELGNDHVLIRVNLPSNYSVLKVLDVVKDLIKVDFDLNNFWNDDLLKFLELDSKNFYTNSYNSVLWYFRQNIFSSHPYFYLNIGNPQNVRYINIEDIRDFLRYNKIEPIFLLILSRNESESIVYNYINSTFGRKQEYVEKGDKYYYRRVDISKPRTFSFYVDSKSSYFLYLFTAPEFNSNFDEYLSMLILDGLLCDPLDGLLWKRLREEKGLVYTIFSEYPLLKYTSYYSIFTSCYYKNQNEVKKIITDTLENLEINDDLLAYYKGKIIAKNSLVLNSADSLADSILYSTLYYDKKISPFYISDHVLLVNLEKLRNVYKKYFKNYYLFIFQGNNSAMVRGQNRNTQPKPITV